MNSILLRSTLLRTSVARRGLSSVCVRPVATTTPCGVVDSFRCPSLVLTLDGARSLEKPQRRLFSGSSSVSNKASVDALVDMLEREHAEEMENNSTETPEALKDLHHTLTEEKGWKIVTDDATAMTKLLKTVDGTKVQVSFHCQDATERMSEQEEDAEDPNNPDADHEEEEEPASVRCTVTITKGGKTLMVVCIAQDSMIRIQNTAMAGTVTDIDALHASGVDPNLYQGPEFTELAEDLQDAFHSYMEDYLGINNDVAAYIAMQFDYKEQCQYVKFLAETKSLLA